MEGKLLFCPVVSRILTSLIFDDTVEILFVIVKRFFFVIPGDFDDETDRLFVLIIDVVIRFGDNGWDISSFVVVDKTVNDEDVGNDDETVLFIIIRGVGLDTIGCIGGVEGPDEDNKISVMEFICSLKNKKNFCMERDRWNLLLVVD